MLFGEEKADSQHVGDRKPHRTVWVIALASHCHSDAEFRPHRARPHLALTKAEREALSSAFRLVSHWVWQVQDKHIPRLCANRVRVWRPCPILGPRAKYGVIILW